MIFSALLFIACWLYLIYLECQAVREVYWSYQLRKCFKSNGYKSFPRISFTGIQRWKAYKILAESLMEKSHVEFVNVQKQGPRVTLEL